MSQITRIRIGSGIRGKTISRGYSVAGEKNVLGEAIRTGPDSSIVCVRPQQLTPDFEDFQIRSKASGRTADLLG